MKQIDNISDDANQLSNVILDDGSIAAIQLVYRPATQRWTLTVSRGTFKVEGIQVTYHQNLMRQWRHLIPFGIACTTVDMADPVFIDDFSSGRAALYVLSESEVDSVEQDFVQVDS